MRPRSPTRRSRAAGAATALAVVAGLLSVAGFIRWGNRWYVTEVFARTAGTADGASWEWLYGMLHGAHDAFVGALAFLVVAVVLAWVAWALRRGAR